jgi:hypothetical protein
MIRRMVFAVAATTALLGAGIAPAASASNVHWNVSIGLPAIGFATGAPGFGYVGPAPVVVAPPVFVAPPPAVFFRPGPAFFPAPVVHPYYGPVRWNGYRRAGYVYRR